MKVVVVIPTYNEAGTIKEVLDQLMESAKNMLRHDFYALVVDGNSPDGTSDLVKEFSKKYPNVKLLVEDSKAGLGAAYIQGFKYALNILDADVVVEMDGDLQHDPKDVLRFMEAIDKGSDLVIGSRFTEGGSIPKEWAFYRKFLSTYGSKFSKLILGIPGVNDFTSGFKATRVKGFLDKVDFSELSSSGFAYKIELLFKFHKMGAKITEVPIAFGMRDRGTSKMEFRNFADSLVLVLKLRFLDLQNLITFLVVGSIGFFVDTFIFNIITFLGRVGALTIRSLDWPIGTIASLMSGFIAMFVTFTLNNFWTFNSRKVTTAGSFVGSIVLYYGFSYIPILFRSWLVKHAVDTFGDNFYVNNIAFLTGIFIGLVWNFTVYSKVIWRRSKQTDPAEVV